MTLKRISNFICVVIGYEGVPGTLFLAKLNTTIPSQAPSITVYFRQLLCICQYYKLWQLTLITTEEQILYSLALFSDPVFNAQHPQVLKTVTRRSHGSSKSIQTTLCAA